MPRLAPILLVGLALTGGAPAAAQTWDRYGGYGSHGEDWRDDRYGGRDWNAVPSTFDWRSQLDRPGDYRCDAYWDAGRTDCDARWRDQRHRVSPQARRDYRELAGYRRDDYGRYEGYGYGYGGYDGGYGYGYGYGYDDRRDHYRAYRRGYGSASGYGHGAGGATYHGAYGRPDHVFPGDGRSYGGRDPGRIAWCRATYRSYDPGSGYYRAWSGRMVWCG